MSIFWKLGIIAALALLVFGGGAIASYELFFKKPASRPSKGNEAVVTPTPDPSIGMLQQARDLMAKGNIDDGKALLISIFQSFPHSAKADDARKIVGDMNIQDFFSPKPAPDKKDYTVQRGDSIARIASKTKATPELIFKANGLDSLRIQPGQRFIIPSGQFSLQIFLKDQAVQLMNHGVFFRSYKSLDFHLPPNINPGQSKVIGKEAWSGGGRVSFGSKNYLGSSRWIIIGQNGITIYSETNLTKPNAQKPKFGIQLAPEDMEELYALLARDTPVTISK